MAGATQVKTQPGGSSKEMKPKKTVSRLTEVGESTEKSGKARPAGKQARAVLWKLREERLQEGHTVPMLRRGQLEGD